jgi:cytochrome oxidase assembly protein ShyY1
MIARARFLVPSLMSFAMIAVTLSLGVWQIERKAVKESLIAALDARIDAAPQPLPPPSEWSKLTPERDEFRRVRFAARFTGSDAFVYAGAGSPLRTDVSGPGTWAFAPAKLANGETVVVDRGFVAEGQQSRIVVPQGEAELVGVIRFPESRGWLTPAEDRAKRLWFLRDHAEIARASGWGTVAPFYIDLESPAPDGGVPKPGAVQPKLRNEHLQYALTWFGLALVVAGGFGVWLRQQMQAGR